MSWPGAFLVFLVSHGVGDVLLQTDWQAVTKTRGLRDRIGRRALVGHVAIYTLAFVPALVWVADERSVGRAIAVAVAIAIPHLLVDDGTVVRGWLQVVKGTREAPRGLSIAVDQTFHVLCLFGAALLANA
jgi:Protein of unknown function (DUF3307)